MNRVDKFLIYTGATIALLVILGIFIGAIVAIFMINMRD